MTQSAPAPEASRLLRREEAADYLGIGLNKLNELIQTGQLASVGIPPKPGGKRPARRIEQAELDRFIERNRTAAS